MPSCATLKRFLYNQTDMEKVVQKFDSFEQANKADYEYYQSLSGNEKLVLMLQIMEPAYASSEGFERVHKVVELKRS